MKTYRHLIIIAVLGFVFLLPGLGLDSALTTKDEYLLSLRTPMEMIERGEFLTPHLDQVPRLKKPPLLYWLMYLSYSALGTNLYAARIWGVLSAIGLAAVTGGVFRRLGAGRKETGLAAAIVTLSCAGVAIQGRMALLDLPLAFLSTLSVYLFLVWKDTERALYLLASAAVCGLSTLLKGPVGPIIVLTAIVTNFVLLGGWRSVSSKKAHWAGAIAAFIAVSVPWTAAMYLIWKELFIEEVYNELVRARFLTSGSTGPEAVLGGILALLLPWSPLYLRSIGGAIRGGLKRENRMSLWLLAWSLASLVPFLLLKVKFERYLLVAVPPAVLLLATVPYGSAFWKRLAFGATSVIYLAVGLGFIAFGFWFRVTPLCVLLPLLFFLGLFSISAWRGKGLIVPAVAAGLFHMLLFGAMYPGIGVQAVPRELVTALKASPDPVYYFMGDNPGLLSMELKRSIQKVGGPDEIKRLSSAGVNLIVEEKDEREFAKALRAADVPQPEPALEFRSFYSRVGWANFAREGATREDWDSAFEKRSLEGLKTTFRLYHLGPDGRLKTEGADERN